MGLVEGTNCGFVLIPPTTDPAETAAILDNYAAAIKFVAPVGLSKVIEMGMYVSVNPDESQDWEMGIYEHDAGNDRPGILVAKTAPIANTNGVGWKVSGVLDISLTPGVTYWIALQIDQTGARTYVDSKTTASYKRDYKGSGETELEDPWGVSDGTGGRLLSFYAHYTTGVPAFPVARLRKGLLSGFHVFMNQYIKAKEESLAPLKKPDGTVF